MTAAAVKRVSLPRSEPVRLELGTVESEASLRVRFADESFPAERAKSCLVAPETGDQVLCAISADGLYVLAVLVGRDASTTCLRAEGELRLEAEQLVMRGQRKTEVRAGEQLHVGAPTIAVQADKGRVAVEDLGFVGRLVRTQAAKVTLVAEELDQAIDRWMQRAKRVFRQVEGMEQVRAGNMDVEAEGLMKVHADNTVMTSKLLTKIDAKQVHLG